MTIRVTKTARDATSALAPSLFYESAREGMGDFLAARLTTTPDLRVLLPGFIGWSPHEGSGVFDPVRELGLPVDFYRLHNDLTVDVDDLAARLKDGPPAVLVLIHYFGHTDPALAKVADMATAAGAVLVEDLAHGFYTSRADGPAGRHGDLLMFSLHKMFPTPGATGGMVTYRNRSLLAGQASTRPDLAGLLLDYDWREIADRRRRNHADIHARLLALRDRVGGFDLLWPDLADDDVPQTLPVRIAGPGRDGIYQRMNDEGFGMVSLYHTLIPEVRDLADMTALAATIINFPVHQDVPVDAIGPMIDSFEAALLARSTQ